MFPLVRHYPGSSIVLKADEGCICCVVFRSEVDDGNGLVSLKEFIAVCAKMKVNGEPLVVSEEEAQAIFRRFGYEDEIPYRQWADMLIVQPSEQLSEMPGAPRCSYQLFSSLQC